MTVWRPKLGADGDVGKRLGTINETVAFVKINRLQSMAKLA